MVVVGLVGISDERTVVRGIVVVQRQAIVI